MRNHLLGKGVIFTAEIVRRLNLHIVNHKCAIYQEEAEVENTRELLSLKDFHVLQRFVQGHVEVLHTEKLEASGQYSMDDAEDAARVVKSVFL